VVEDSNQVVFEIFVGKTLRSKIAAISVLDARGAVMKKKTIAENSTRISRCGYHLERRFRNRVR
jgi:hypothetical protein